MIPRRVRALHAIDIADDTFIRASQSRVRSAISDRTQWGTWWPHLQLQITEDRAHEGIRWQVSGELSGSMEIWLEAVHRGVVLHYFLRANPDDSSMSRRKLDRVREQHRVAFREHMWQLKDTCEASADDQCAAPVR